MDFIVNRYDQEENSAYEISWARDILSKEDIDQNNVYNIMFILDKSGSMQNNINTNKLNTPSLIRQNSIIEIIDRTSINSSLIKNRNISQSPLLNLGFKKLPGDISKSQLLINTVDKCLNLISNMNKLGMNIRISIIMFDTNAKLVYPYNKIDEIEYNNIKLKLNEWCDPDGNTDMNSAFCLTKSIIDLERKKNPESIFHNILLSDGYNNNCNDNELIINYGSLITSAIGLGNINDYNHELFCKLVNDDNTYCASTADDLMDCFLYIVFGTTTKVATELEITISMNDIITPHEFKKEGDKTIIRLDSFHSHRKVFFISPKSIDFIVCYKNNNQLNNCIIFNQSNIIIENNNDMFNIIDIYCKLSTKFKNIFSTTETTNDSINKQKEQLIELNKEILNINIPKSNIGIYGYINTLIKNIKNLSVTKETKEYLSFMNHSIRETSSGNYSVLQRHASMKVDSNSNTNIPITPTYENIK